MIAEKAADMLRDKDSVKPIREYFKHLLDVKHDRCVMPCDHVTAVQYMLVTIATDKNFSS